MAKTFKIDIIAPDKVALQDEIEFLAVPAYDGEMGILPGHAPLLAQLRPGILRLKKSEEVKLFAISGGFIEVHPQRVEVFAETAEMAEDIDVERVRTAEKRARDTISGKLEGEELLKAQASLKKALIRLRVVEGLHRVRRRSKK